MKKVVFILLIFLSLLLWQGINIYVNVQADKDNGINQIIPVIEHELGLRVIDYTRFHGDQLYIVFTCVDPQEQSHSYVFVYDDQYQQIPFDQILISKEKAIDLAQEQFPELISIARVVPGIVNQQFVWEISGYDQEENLYYVYYTMESGSFLKRYTVNLLTK